MFDWVRKMDQSVTCYPGRSLFVYEYEWWWRGWCASYGNFHIACLYYEMTIALTNIRSNKRWIACKTTISAHTIWVLMMLFTVNRDVIIDFWYFCTDLFGYAQLSIPKVKTKNVEGINIFVATLRLSQRGHQFADGICKCIFPNKKFWMSWLISWKHVP